MIDIIIFRGYLNIIYQNKIDYRRSSELSFSSLVHFLTFSTKKEKKKQKKKEKYYY
jgi:hypothetical protein